MDPPVDTNLPTLLALDFDWSLVEENSDTFVLSAIGADDFYKQGRAQGIPWTQLMDRCLLASGCRLLQAACHSLAISFVTTLPRQAKRCIMFPKYKTPLCCTLAAGGCPAATTHPR